MIIKQGLSAKSGVTSTLLPSDYNFLCIKEQFGVPVLYANSLNPSYGKRVNIHCAYTGEDVHLTAIKYLGTCSIYNGTLVLHYFEVE